VKAPFYKWAALERPLEPPRWNFLKYLHRLRATSRRTSRQRSSRPIPVLLRKVGPARDEANLW
jgi:hypothetical protein